MFCYGEFLLGVEVLDVLDGCESDEGGGVFESLDDGLCGLWGGVLCEVVEGGCACDVGYVFVC